MMNTPPRQSVVFIQHMMLEVFVVLVGQKHATTEVKEAGRLSPASVGHDCEDPGLSSANLQADKQLTVLLQRLLPAPCWRLPPLLSLCFRKKKVSFQIYPRGAMTDSSPPICPYFPVTSSLLSLTLVFSVFAPLPPR